MPAMQVIGVCSNRPAAERVVGNLRLSGFGQDVVSLIVVHREESDALDHVDDQHGAGAPPVMSSVLKGTALGAVSGAVLGTATLFIPGLQVLSPIILVLLYVGSCAFAGALSGAFASESVSEEVINR